VLLNFTSKLVLEVFVSFNLESLSFNQTSNFRVLVTLQLCNQTLLVSFLFGLHLLDQVFVGIILLFLLLVNHLLLFLQVFGSIFHHFNLGAQESKLNVHLFNFILIFLAFCNE